MSRLFHDLQKILDESDFVSTAKQHHQKYLVAEHQCEHCGEYDNLGNLGRWHKNGECIERKQVELQICEDYKNGLYMVELINKYNKSDGGINTILKKHNTPIRKRKTKCQYCKNEVSSANLKRDHNNGKCLERIKIEKLLVSDYKKGVKRGKLSKKYNIPIGSINGILKRHNVPNKYK